MTVFRTQTIVHIYGTKNAWSLETDAPQTARTETVVNLEIQGTESDGYNFVMSPVGFFTADYWYQTLDEALEAGLVLFSAPKDSWQPVAFFRK